MKSELISILILFALVSLALFSYAAIPGNAITSESISSIFRIFITILFLYLVWDIAVSLRAIAKREK
jgi:hypothetical protein